MTEYTNGHRRSPLAWPSSLALCVEVAVTVAVSIVKGRYRALAASGEAPAHSRRLRGLSEAINAVTPHVLCDRRHNTGAGT